MRWQLRRVQLSFHLRGVESYGAFGRRAVEVVKVLTAAARDSTVALAADVPGGFSNYVSQRLAVTLQRGNATIARRGAVKSRLARLGRR